MCGLYSLSKTPRETKAWFQYQEEAEFPPRAHVAPGQPIGIVRMENGQQRSIPFDYKRVRKGEGLEQNIILKSGDVIVVP